ncbi:MAG: class I SAM-dependent methyltransferase [Spirochaetales bacterium]|nr:class I SAM-dependent methyltransferase [Spirochaetales bacterium]
MEKYWNERYAKEGKIWGDMPSTTALYAKDLFLEKNVKTVLIPGFGYGRNAWVFVNESLVITGVEISDEAIKLAENEKIKMTILKSSLLDLEAGDTYDAVYCSNFLHYFPKDERKKAVDKCLRFIKPSGYLFLAAFSEKDALYKKGKEVDENTFENEPGMPAHYFNEDDFLALFKDADLDIIDTGCMNDAEKHGEGPHTHILRYIFAQKKS